MEATAIVISIAALVVSGVSLWITMVRDREDRHLRLMDRRTQALIGILKQKGLMRSAAMHLRDYEASAHPEVKDSVNSLIAAIESVQTDLEETYENLKNNRVAASLPSYADRIGLEDVFGSCDVLLERANQIAMRVQFKELGADRK